MCLPMKRKASGWRCKTVQKGQTTSASDRQRDRQVGRQLTPFQTRRTSGKIEFQLHGSCFQS